MQVLRLSNTAMASTTTGNIVNLVSSDTQRFDVVSSSTSPELFCHKFNNKTTAFISFKNDITGSADPQNSKKY